MVTGPANRFSLQDRVAVVTGAARGIGAATARCLAELGATVVLTDLSPTVEATAKELKAEGLNVDHLVFDVTDNAAVQTAVDTVLKKFGKVDAFVANAGIAGDRFAEDYSVKDWRRVMDLNVDSVFFSTQAFAVPMLARKAGAIVLIASMSALIVARPERHVAYDVSKAAVAHMARSLGVEWAKRGVRVNAVAPGYTDTEMLAQVGREKPEVRDLWLADIPSGRFIRPDEVAHSIAFLLSDAASGMTAHLMVVDQGYSIGKGV